MQVYEVSFTRRLASGVSNLNIWLDSEGVEDFVPAVETALSNKSIKIDTVRVTDVFDINRYIAMQGWEQISVRELRGVSLKQAIDQITAYHATTSHDGKVIDISRRHSGTS